jgi:Outer membrane protein beta-barrel domain
MKRILSFAMCSALVIAAPAMAAPPSHSSPGGGEIGFGVGQANVSSSDTTGIDSAQFLGVRGGYNFTKQWQLEGQVASSSESGDISGTSVDTTMRLIMVNGVMNFHPAKKEIVPYVMAGIGRADVEVDASGTNASDNSVAYQVGGGTRVFFGKTQRMAFRADLSFLRDTTFDDSTTSTTVTAGLTWKLGR